MRVCENHDFVVVYDNGKCPVCEMKISIESLELQVEEFWSELEDLLEQAIEDKG